MKHIAFAIVAAFVVGAGTYALQSGVVSPRHAEACDPGAPDDPLAEAVFERSRQAEDDVKTYHLVSTYKETVDQRVTEWKGDYIADLEQQRTYGHPGWPRGSEYYGDWASDSAYRRMPGQDWVQLPDNSEAAPDWNCDPVRTTVFDIEEGTVVIRTYKRLNPSGQEDYDTKIVANLYDRETGLLTLRRSTWYEEVWANHQRIAFQSEQVCEFSDFNVAVVFPDDLPVAGPID